MTKPKHSGAFKCHRFPPEIIVYAVWAYYRFSMSLRDVEDLLAERGIIVSYETIRKWVSKFGRRYTNANRRGRTNGICTRLFFQFVARNTGYGEPSTATAMCRITLCNRGATSGLLISSSARYLNNLACHVS